MVKVVFSVPIFNSLNIKCILVHLILFFSTYPVAYAFNNCKVNNTQIVLENDLNWADSSIQKLWPDYSFYTSLLCTDFIDTSHIELTIENCDNAVSICINESIGDILTYDITDNGQVYLGGLSPCNFDTSFAYTYLSIPGSGLSGPYLVDAWNVDGIIYTGLVANMEELTDSMNLWDTEGNWTHDLLTASIRGGSTTTNYGGININQVSTGESATIFMTTSLNPNGSQITLDTGYHELIFTEPVEQCEDTLIIVINCIPCGELYSGSTNYELDNCNDNQAVCFEIPTNDYAEYIVSIDGLVYNGSVNACSTDSFYRYDYSTIPGGGVLGPYLLQNWTINNTTYLGGFNTIEDLVDSMNVWDVGASWEIDNLLQIITGGVNENAYSNIEVTQILSNSSGTAFIEKIASDSSLEMELDTGFHEIVFYNTSNQCTDSFEIDIHCIPCFEYLEGGLFSESSSHCDSMTVVCLPVPFSEINDYTFTANGNVYTNGFESCAISNTEIELDTGTYLIYLTQNITGCLDSAIINIVCTPPVVCSDFINPSVVNIQIDTCDIEANLCLEIPFDEISDYTIMDNNIPFTGTIDECNFGTSLLLSIGSHELIFTHELTGCADTLSSLVACIQPDFIDVSVIVMEADFICLDTADLQGEIVSINNFCEDNTGELALVNIDTLTYCLDIEGIEVGTEQFCFEICDNFGFCDTTYVNIEILSGVNSEPNVAPIAIDDYVETQEGISLPIDVLSNDTINGIVNSLEIISFPENGTIRIRADHVIEYVPDADFCSLTMSDSLSYFLCNEVDCDIATVYIEVACENNIIHNGFSPNGDGMNDFFVINTTYNRNNSLSVFNRWGGRVFFEKGYQNTWGGTWRGVDLPDGTYFYHFEEGNGRTASGYVLIQR